jgi:hypothetical protein
MRSGIWDSVCDERFNHDLMAVDAVRSCRCVPDYKTTRCQENIVTTDRRFRKTCPTYF